MVTPGHVVLDVGCDHGYIPISLVQSKKAVYAVASDVREGPLSRAEEHVRQASLEDQISLILASGIPKQFPEEIRRHGFEHCPVSCVIAGMGGMLMVDILRQAGPLLAGIDEFILSPQSDQAYFRKKIAELGLGITEEVFLEEDGKYYTILRCLQQSALSDRQKELLPKTDAELLFGAYLLREQNPVLKKYLDKRKAVLERIRLQLLEHGHGSGSGRMAELSNEERIVNEALAFYGLDEQMKRGDTVS